MNILHKIKIDLSRRQQPERIDVVQGDSMSRSIEIKLYDNGVAYQVPDTVSILQIAYCKPDKTCGLYDELPSGEVACAVVGNTVTAILHPQMFTAAGTVYCELRMIENVDKRLTTFKWIMNVSESVVNKMNSEDYYNFRAISILSINGYTPNNKGELSLAGEDIPANPANIPGFEGSVDDALDKLAEQLFVGSLSGWKNALDDVADSDIWGLPVMDPDSDSSFSPMMLDRAKDEDGPFAVPTTDRLREILASFNTGTGYLDVTEEYQNALVAEEVTCAKEYLWTLPAGIYFLNDEVNNTKFYLTALEGCYEGVTARILREVDDFAWLEFYSEPCAYDAVPTLYVED